MYLTYFTIYIYFIYNRSIAHGKTDQLSICIIIKRFVIFTLFIVAPFDIWRRVGLRKIAQKCTLLYIHTCI